ncbi:MAG: TIGR03067 domain-containing protein [Gemmataceae bacterium]
MASRPTVIAPRKAAWDVGRGDVRELGPALVIAANGGQYWLTSKEPLPDNFHLVVRCQIAFLQGEQVLQISQRSILRMLCVRFATADTDVDMMERRGHIVQFSHALLHLWRDGVAVRTERQGNSEEPFTLSVTKRGGDYTVAIDGETLLRYHDDRPLSSRHPFSIGGYLSRLVLGPVSVTKLDGPAGTDPGKATTNPPTTAPPVAPPRTAAEVRQRLAGQWLLESIETEGRSRAPQHGEQGLLFEDDSVHWVDVSGGRTGTSARLTRIDPKVGTLEMELTEGRDRGKTWRGRFKFENERLVLANAPYGAAEPPTKFTTALRTGRAECVRILRRVAAPSGPLPAPTAEELKRLAGRWLFEAIDERNGAISERRNGDESFRVEGDRIFWTDDRQRDNGQVAKITGLDPQAKPPAIELRMLGGGFTGEVWRGVYQCDGPRLVLALRTAPEPRPTKFTSAEGAGAASMVRIMQRVDDADLKNALRRLDGFWATRRVERATVVVPVPRGREAIFTEGHRLRWTDLQGTRRDGTEMRLVLDPTAKSPTIDLYTCRGGHGPATALGIYRVEGKRLLMALGVPGSGVRPGVFSTAEQEPTRADIIYTFERDDEDAPAP